MNVHDYWREAVEVAADDAGLILTAEQVETMASAIEVSVENMGMAFGGPGSFVDVPRDEHVECRRKVERMEREFDRYREVSEAAVRRGFRLRSDARVQIDDRERVLRVDDDREILLW